MGGFAELMKTLQLIQEANKNIFIKKSRSILTILSIVVGSLSLTLAIGVSAGMNSFFEEEFNNVTTEHSIIAYSPYVANDVSEEHSKNGIPLYVEKESVDITTDGFKIIDSEAVDEIKSFNSVNEVILNYRADFEYMKFPNLEYRFTPIIDYYYPDQEYILVEGELPKEKNEVLISEDFLSLFDDVDVIGSDLSVYFYDDSQEKKEIDGLIVTGVKLTGRYDFPSLYINRNLNKEVHELQYSPESEDYLKSDNARIVFTTDSTSEARDEVRNYLNSQNFVVADLTELSGSAKEVGVYLTIGLIGFASIVISASVFGIINTISMSIYERTREIGILRALGMSKKNIFKMFAFEGSIIGFWGGLVGLVIGYILGLIANPLIANYFETEGIDSGLRLRFPITWLLLALLSLVLIGFLSAVFPARKASKLDPIKALRYE